jgi:hypothetical protein
VQLLDDIGELARLRGEIKQKIFPQRSAAERSQFLLQLLIRRRVRQIADAIKNVRGKIFPDLFVHGLGARKLVERRAQFGSP